MPGRGVVVDAAPHRRLVADQRDRVDEVVGDPRRQLLRMGTRAGELDEVAEPGLGEHLAVARRGEVADVAERQPSPLLGGRVDRRGQPHRRVRVQCAARRAAVAAVTMLSTMRSASAAIAAALGPNAATVSVVAGERLAEPEPVDPLAVDQGPHVARALARAVAAAPARLAAVPPGDDVARRAERDVGPPPGRGDRRRGERDLRR